MTPHPRLLAAAAASVWAVLAAATVWNARQNEVLAAQVAQLREQLAASEAAQARKHAAQPTEAADRVPARAPAAAPAGASRPTPMPTPIAAPETAATGNAPATLEDALVRWRDSPGRAAANPFVSP
jgi:hypothetical protein